MFCDYMLLVFLGLTSGNHGMYTDVGRATEIMRDISRYCNVLPQTLLDLAPALGFNEYNSIIESRNSLLNVGNRYNLEVPVTNLWDIYRTGVFPKRKSQVVIRNYNQLPLIDGTTSLMSYMYNNPLNLGLVRVPESVLLRLMSPDQLSLLYQENQAIPINNPFAPRLTEISAKLLLPLLRARKITYRNPIVSGVIGAQNVWSSSNAVAGNVAGLLGDGVSLI